MRLPVILLAAVLALSFGLHARTAAHPHSAYQSLDERSYGKLAVDIVDHGNYGGPETNMREPLHWPPGAPAVFALGYGAFGSEHDARTFDIRAVYWEQAVLATGTAALAAALAWMLAGAWAGVLAGALVGTYPPLIEATGDQLSEPLGAFLLVAAFVALAHALARRDRPLRWAAAGALFGATALTRADLLAVPFLIAVGGAVVVLLRRQGLRRAGTWGLVALGAALAVAPWTIYASHREGGFVPVTKGSATALLVGTYLPGGGTTIGMKQHLLGEIRARHPGYRHTKAYRIPAEYALDIFARRHPDLPRDEALAREARINLVHYASHEPLAFMRMQWTKAKRMWLFYYRGGGVHYISTPMRVWQIVLVLGCAAGLLAGLVRRREPLLAAVLATIAFSTLIHTIVVSQARYNLPLMPTVAAAGVAGWFLALRRRAPEAQGATSAPAPTRAASSCADAAPAAAFSPE